MSYSPDLEKNQPESNIERTRNKSRVQSDIFNRSNYFIENKIDFRRGSQNRSGFNLVFWSWMSALIDSLVIISISCFCLVLFAFLMKTPMRDILKSTGISNSFVEMFAYAFLLSFWVYLVTMRVFMGASLGEWACQLRLGQPMQRILPGYVLQVAVRTTLIVVSGFLFFPLLSLLFRRDILGDITGIRIYSLT